MAHYMDTLYNNDVKNLNGGDLLFYGGFPNLIKNTNTLKKQQFIKQENIPSFVNTKIKINEILQKRREYIKPLINLTENNIKRKRKEEIISNIKLNDLF